jgi:hypothetical protein
VEQQVPFTILTCIARTRLLAAVKEAAKAALSTARDARRPLPVYAGG